MEYKNMDNEDFLKPIQICFDLLKRANIGFFDANEPLFRRHWRSFYIVPFIFIHFIAMSCYMKSLSVDSKISKLAFMVSAYLITNQVILKALIIIKNKSNVEAIVTSLGALWKTDCLTKTQNERRSTFLKRLHIVRKIFYWLCLVASWQNLLTPLFVTALLKYQGHHDQQLPFGYVLPFELDTWRYLAVYIFQCYTMLRLVYVYLGTELLKIILCAYLSIEFMLLQEDLKYILRVKKPEDVMRTLKILIRRHQVLINLSVLLNNIFNQMIFFDLLFATITACFFAFAATCTREIILVASNFSGVCGILTPIYIYCYYSTVLGEESSRIADAVYEDLWYQGGRDYQKTICFIIARSRYPCYLTALKRVPLTLQTFNRVVSTTWSYFSLANSLYSE